MQANDGDPLDWTVDEVVSFLCSGSQTPWSQSDSPPPRPNPVVFEATLRNNLITGEILLQVADTNALRDDLGLNTLGPRISIMMAIRYLQQRSPKFQQFYGTFSRSERSPSNAPPPPHYTTTQPEPNHPSTPLPNSGSEVIPLSATSQPPLLKSSPRIGTSAQTLKLHSDATGGNRRPRSVSHTAPIIFNPEQPAEGAASVHVRPQEHVVLDNQGRKRRRLNLGSPSKPEIKDLAPEFIGDEIRANDWYVGPNALTPAELFYPPKVAEEEHAFAMICPKIPPAQRTFVNRRLNHFFRQQPIKINSNQDHEYSALVPYPPMMVKDSSQRFFTSYKEKNGKVSINKEKIEDCPPLKYLLKEKHQSSSDFFSHLLEKYRENPEDALPLYGDSGSEGEFDDETWQEIDHERDDPVPKKLTELEIGSIIQDCISEFENNWLQVRQPREQFKARKLWLSAKKGNRTNGELKAITNEILRLGSRLKRFKEGIHENEYTSPNELRAQCKSLEETVSNIQKEKWRRSILEQATCPPKVARPPKPRYTPRPRQGDEESLHSESDAASVDLSDNFIDDSEEINQLVEQRSVCSTSSLSDGDDDIISVSGTLRSSKAQRAQRNNFFASSSSSPPPSIHAEPDIIDLTMESPESEELTIETPPLNPVQPTRPKTHSEKSVSMSPAPSLGSMPSKVERQSTPPLLEPDETDISSVSWDQIEQDGDRQRLLAKLIACLPSDERRNLRSKIPSYKVPHLRGLVKSGLRALRKGRQSVGSLGEAENQVIMRTTSLYISWVNCVRLQLSGIPKSHIEKALSSTRNFQPFYYELCDRLRDSRIREQKKNAAASAVEGIRPEQLDITNSPHKTRKREVKESQEVKLNQESAQRRVALQDKQRKRLERVLESKGLNNEDPSHQAVSFGSPVIYLDSHIGRRVKQHQLNGIQFMWRELIEDTNQQGCLLAHTMGLGKTMQVISLLVTISAAATSDDPKIRRQVPEVFHRSQTLILCPTSLIENWYDEFLMWAPKNLNIGPFRTISSPSTLRARLEEISSWDGEGGVLIMGYEMFRKLINNKETKNGRPLSEADHENVRKWLLEGPNIIVADEAHKMKNPTSAITTAASQFRSKSRIALTGSPLANSLTDYYTMVNWIAEGYLGEFIEFKANYIEPIQEGLYVDSTHSERRRSLVKLQVLKRNLDPKINRADITVMKGSLPPKVEFVITVPLSPLQKTAYDSYVSSVLSGADGDVATARIWGWIAILGYCCHHPSCFREKILSRTSDAANQNKKLDDSEQEVPGDEPITQAGFADVPRLISEQERIFANVPDMMALDLSPRAEILNRIIDESIMAGDKILIFSQSIPTLNFIEYILKASNRSYSRLDGKTPINSRQQAIKQFNLGSEKHVYLISTRAGGLGLNIPGANRVVIFDFSFSPVWEEQAVGRAYRLGQQKPVYVYRFIAGGTFEEIIHQKAVFKTQLAYRVVDKKNPVRYSSKKLGEYLFPVKDVHQEDIAEFIGKDPSVLDKILREETGDSNRRILKITLTETFQKESNDKLTEEEKQGVEQELNEERLKRTDPEAYSKLLAEKQRQLYMAAQPACQPSYQPSHLPPYQPSIPPGAHNFRPPVLGPDTTISRPPVPAGSNPFPSPQPLLHPHSHPLPLSARLNRENNSHSPSTPPATHLETPTGTGDPRQQQAAPEREQPDPSQPEAAQSSNSCRSQ